MGVGTTNPTIQFRIFGSFELTWLPGDLERAVEIALSRSEQWEGKDGGPGNEIPKESSEDRLKTEKTYVRNRTG